MACRVVPLSGFQPLPCCYTTHIYSKMVLLWPAGWRRFQSLPVFATEDANGRHRMLKYTPEHMHCLAAVWGPLAPPNTGVIAIQNPSNDQQVRLSVEHLHMSCLWMCQASSLINPIHHQRVRKMIWNGCTCTAWQLPYRAPSMATVATCKW